MAPGVKPAPGIFQQIIDTSLAGLPVVALIDDILVPTSGMTEHNQVLREVFRRLETLGFRVKMSKCEFYKSSIKFLGFIIDADGSRPDPDKISAIQNMQAPTNISQLRSLLGAINYHNKYIKNLRKIRAPLDELTKQAVVWNWSTKCQQAFDEIKSVLSSNLHLTHYDPGLPLLVSADASIDGIGACLAHTMPDGSEKMVSCASRALTETEQRYSQIEKEGLAIVWAVKNFIDTFMAENSRFSLTTNHYCKYLAVTRAFQFT